VVLTNEFGLHIFDGLRTGLPVGAIAKQIAEMPEDHDDAVQAIHSVLASWEHAGLLTTDAPAFPNPVAYVPASGEPLRIGGRGGTADVFIPHKILSEQVWTILGHMTPQLNQPRTTLSAQPDGDGFAVFRDGQALSGRISLDAARFVILREMAEIVCGAQRVAAVFHAGCVSQNGNGLLICGDSGQGKSTLTFGLVAAGCDYMGDDHIPLHRDGRSAMSFPSAAGVKPGSWNLPEIAQLQSRFGLTALSPREGVRYIPLHRTSAIDTGEKRPIKAVIFPSFRPDAPFRMERITPEQALIQALQAGSRPSHSHNRDLAPLCKFLNDVPAYALYYSSSDQSVPACLKLLSSPQT
jgi:hypothetical protein